MMFRKPTDFTSYYLDLDKIIIQVDYPILVELVKRSLYSLCISQTTAKRLIVWDNTEYHHSTNSLKSGDWLEQEPRTIIFLKT